MEKIIEHAITHWHPLWFLLAVTQVLLILGLWKLGQAYVNLVAKFVHRQEADARIKGELVTAFRSLKDAIRGALDELEG